MKAIIQRLFLSWALFGYRLRNTDCGTGGVGAIRTTKRVLP